MDDSGWIQNRPPKLQLSLEQEADFWHKMLMLLGSQTGRMPAGLQLAVLLAIFSALPVQAAELDLDTPIDIVMVWIDGRDQADDSTELPKTEEQAPAEEPAPAEPAIELDLDQLETRLRKTKAIGVFTKLELKGQVGDLLDDFEGYHEQDSQLSLEQLEERFDLLVMKLLLLLQDDDPELHRDIADARPTLWATLSNADQFSEVNGP